MVPTNFNPVTSLLKCWKNWCIRGSPRGEVRSKNSLVGLFETWITSRLVFEVYLTPTLICSAAFCSGEDGLFDFREI